MQTQFDKGDNEKPMAAHPQDRQPQKPSYGQQPGEPMPPDNPQAPPYYGAQPTPPGSVPGWAPAYGGYRGQAPVSPADARTWSMFAHLGGTLMSLIAPLVIYLVYKDRDPFIRRHAAQALNFHIFVFIVYFATISLSLVGVIFFPLPLIVILFLAFCVAMICVLVFTIMGAVAAHHGREYTYPLTPKMVT